MTELNGNSQIAMIDSFSSVLKTTFKKMLTITAPYEDPNGFNMDTVLALKDASDRKNMGKVYNSLEEMYEDLNV